MTFYEWWEKHGQFCRAGGGEYEKTFAFRAWEAATEAECEDKKMVEVKLPEAFRDGCFFTATQMIEYGTACAEEEREACAELCLSRGAGEIAPVSFLARAIRERSNA